MFSFSSFLGFLFHSCQSVPLGPNADSCSSSVPEGVWLKSGDPWGYMVFPELPKSTKLGKKTHSKLHTGFVPLAVAQLEKRHVTAPTHCTSVLELGWRWSCPNPKLGKMSPRVCLALNLWNEKEKKNKKRACVWFQHEGQCVLHSSKLLPWFWRKLMEFYSVLGAQLYSSRQVVLG